MKKVLALLLLFATLFLSACTRYENVKLDEDENGFYWLYQEKKYYEDSSNFFFHRWELNEDDSYPSQKHIQIGSYYSFPFSTSIYSYTTESPLYIYESHESGRLNDLHFREDYDYTMDTFCIKNTNAKIVWKDILGAQTAENYYTLDSFSDKIVMPVHSEQHPSIWTCLMLARSQEQWYILFENVTSYITYTASDTFVQLLADNGII